MRLHTLCSQSYHPANPQGGLISEFDYSYNPVGNITAWTQQNSGSGTPQTYSFGYDNLNQLTSATQGGATDYFNYDKAGNRIAQQISRVKTQAVYNFANQLVRKEQGGTTGLTHFVGTVDKPSIVTVGGTVAKVDPQGKFDGAVNLESGTNSVAIVAVDANGNKNTKTYQVVATSGSSTSLTYDANGNLLNDGTKTYEWDAADRLIAINYTGSTKRTEFSYDPLGRRSRIVEKTGDTVDGEKNLVWNGLEIAEERDNTNTVTKRYYGQGMQVTSGSNAGSYYYTRDHLGSVREMTNSTGAIRARYSYDVWGNRSGNLITTNPVETDFGYTGHYYHGQSALWLAPYRAYDPTVGRWISRDPLEEKGGMNLYGYVGNSPVNGIDPLGLWVSYDGGGSAVSWAAWTRNFANEWNTKEGRSQWEKKYNSCNEYHEYSNGDETTIGNTWAIPIHPHNVDIDDNIAKAASSFNPNWFYNQVKNKGPWDYKQLGAQCQDFGNYNYGATGAAFGFPVNTLLREAGRAQQAAGTSQSSWGNPGSRWNPFGGSGSYGDDPADQVQIKKGIGYYISTLK